MERVIRSSRYRKDLFGGQGQAFRSSQPNEYFPWAAFSFRLHRPPQVDYQSQLPWPLAMAMLTPKTPPTSVVRIRSIRRSPKYSGLRVLCTGSPSCPKKHETPEESLVHVSDWLRLSMILFRLLEVKQPLRLASVRHLDPVKSFYSRTPSYLPWPGTTTSFAASVIPNLDSLCFGTGRWSSLGDVSALGDLSLKTNIRLILPLSHPSPTPLHLLSLAFLSFASLLVFSVPPQLVYCLAVGFTQATTSAEKSLWPRTADRHVRRSAPAPYDPNRTSNLPLTPDTWNKLRLDDYLLHYQGGQNLTLQEYAFAQHAQNFICGIGEGCHAGQLGNPVTAPAWYVLYATQEWNAVQNSIYTAIGFAVSMVQATAAALVTDLFAPEHRSVLFKLQDVFVILSAIAFAVALGAIIATAPAAVIISTVVAGALAAGTSTVLTGINLVQSWDHTPDHFTRWSNYAYYMSQWQSKVQDQIANSTASVIRSGISTPGGISGVLKGGGFLSEIQIQPISAIEQDIKRTMTVRILVDIIRSQNGYVTYKSDPCKGKGPNGAWAGDDYLSFCKDGVMMNIVKAEGKKTENRWHNAHLIAKKYGITTEYLVTQSYECQKKYKDFGYDPYRNGSLPSDANAECIANLPVCDCSDAAVKRAKAKGHTTTRACREQGKLPI
ncbi:hypothetical protein O181_003683 [Austropuccinia psidii MF-1]|uniref:DUF7872 domain-containing protein n=1 Tax=Austropuccinia psidii MF-1 TaxID=1389203 RepID=A0A9Q3BEW4_9BASI|nr:hypothetical protein [Austropuccinia psidii MF-1]